MPRARRRCPQVGCDELLPCPTHPPSKQYRPTRQSRGYDAEHQRAHQAWAPMVASGRVTCRRASNGTCRFAPDTLIHRGQPWQLGHPDAECPAPRAPEHRACNLSAPGRIRGREARIT